MDSISALPNPVPVSKSDTTKRPLTAVVAAHVTNALDALSPALAPFAARWDAEADRRAQLRTPENLKALMAAQREHTAARSTAATAKSQRAAARKGSANPLSAARRAARTADKAARGHRAEAKAKLKAARADYPATLRARAVQAHAVHCVPAVLSSYVMSTPTDLTVWPASVSSALVGLHVAGLWLGRRRVEASVDDELTAEERRLAARLDPSYWVQHADERGLSGTVPTPAELTPAGLVSHVRLDGRWTPRALRAKGDEIRALIGARTDLRMEIKAGSHGDRATLTLRTRSAADGMDLSGWEPGAPWGVDTVTGEPVTVPLGRRMLVAGTSGSGKSWSTRAILAAASETPDHRLVVIDPKRVEAINWAHRARVAVKADEILAVTDELTAEMEEREGLIPRGQDVIQISPERPRITVFVDEGGEVIALAKSDKAYARIIESLRSIARRARAAEIILIWATQKPTMSGEGHGIDSQIAGQITYRASLALSSAGESQVVFGQDAHDKGWHAHELPMPGYAMLRSHPKARPHHIRTRAMSPQDVIALPDRPVWSRESVPSRPTGAPLTLLKSDVPACADGTDLTDNQRAVLKVVRDGATTNAEIARETGLNTGSVDRAVKALAKRGFLTKDGSTITPVGGAA